MQRRRHELLVLGLASTFPVAMFGQACQGLAGTWYDDSGFTWHLTQSGNSVSGSIDDPHCGSGWSVNGSVSESGFTLTATGSGCPASSFTYTGTNYAPGCDYGDGSWTNDLGDTGYFNWSNGGSCPLPDYESNPTGDWEFVQGAIYDWIAVLGSLSGEEFGGRTVQEVDAGYGSDSCWFPDSPYAKADHLLNPGTWVIDWNETYVDAVGWTNNAFYYYRGMGRAPCGSKNYQNMQMACASSLFAQYTQNFLGADIHDGPNLADKTATSYRSYWSATHLW